MRFGGRGGIRCAELYPAACADALPVSCLEEGAMPERVLPLQLPLQHGGEDFHGLAALGPHAGARLHALLVDHPQRPELDVLRIEVVGERETMEGLQPALVGIAAIAASANL